MPRRPLAASAAILLLSVGSAATPPDTTRSAFPLRVEAGTRYLVDAQGAPFLIHGDTAWSLIAQLTRRDIDTYLEDRARRGFNAILVNLLEHHFAARAPANAQGDAPFLTAGDFATPNPAYFAHAEYAIARAAEKGMLVMLTPAYMGFGGGTHGVGGVAGGL